MGELKKQQIDKEIEEFSMVIMHKFGYNLSNYRNSCLQRRINARKRSVHVDNIYEYLRYIEENPSEIHYLIDTITIHVTEFFRDRSAFDYLRDYIIPELIESKSGKTLRVWSAGCSTGEEAYTLAIVLKESLDAYRSNLDLLVIGTDISTRAIQTAERGVYSAEKVSGLSNMLLRKFFEKDGHYYKVKETLRKNVKFFTHDLTSDPPVKETDILVCRNVLIHFKEPAKRRIILQFSRSLNDGGYLVLGKSEAVCSEISGIFELINGHEKIYRKEIRALTFKEDR